MRSIEWNHKVELTVTEGDNEGNDVRVIVAENLTPYQLDDLQYVLNERVLEDCLDLRLRRTILEVLRSQPPHGYTDLIGLQSMVCQNLQPFRNKQYVGNDATVEAVEFNKAVDEQIDRLRAMGVVNCNYDPELGYAMSGVKLTVVGGVLCEVLFGS